MGNSLSGDSNGQRYPCPSSILRVFFSRLQQGSRFEGDNVLQNMGEFLSVRGGDGALGGGALTLGAGTWEEAGRLTRVLMTSSEGT